MNRKSTLTDNLTGEGGPSGLAPADDPAYHKITAQEAKNMIDTAKVILVDVRRENEYKKEHIPGSILLPNETVDKEAFKTLPDQNAVLLVYCRSGQRSKQAALKLEQMGYRHIYDFGGILDWPYETEKP